MFLIQDELGVGVPTEEKHLSRVRVRDEMRLSAVGRKAADEDMLPDALLIGIDIGLKGVRVGVVRVREVLIGLLGGSGYGGTVATENNGLVQLGILSKEMSLFSLFW